MAIRGELLGFQVQGSTLNMSLVCKERKSEKASSQSCSLDLLITLRHFILVFFNCRNNICTLRYEIPYVFFFSLFLHRRIDCMTSSVFVYLFQLPRLLFTAVLAHRDLSQSYESALYSII